MAPTINGVALAALVSVSLVATTAVDTVPVQAGAAPVHNGSPPPVAVTLLMLGLSAEAATFTGTVMMMVPTLAGKGIVQPAKLLPPITVGQPVSAPLLVLATSLSGVPLNVIPVGKISDSVMSDVVGLPAIVMVIL